MLELELDTLTDTHEAMLDLDTLTFEQLCEKHALFQREIAGCEEAITRAREASRGSAEGAAQGDNFMHGMDVVFEFLADLETETLNLCRVSVAECEREIDRRRVAMRLTLCQALHPRLGLNSPVRALSPEIVACIGQAI